MLQTFEDTQDRRLTAVTLEWGNPYYTKLSLATVGGRPPDVAVSHLSRVPTLVEAGQLQALDPDAMAAHGMAAEDFEPVAWDKATVRRRHLRGPPRHPPVRALLQHRHLQEGRPAGRRRPARADGRARTRSSTPWARPRRSPAHGVASAPSTTRPRRTGGSSSRCTPSSAGRCSPTTAPRSSSTTTRRTRCWSTSSGCRSTTS